MTPDEILGTTGETRRLCPVLFKKDSDGRIRTWRLELESGLTEDDEDGGRYRTISGIVGMKQAESGWTICEPKNVGRKNGTTAGRQAELEVIADYDKKLKRGYVCDIADVDKPTIFKPMLAHIYQDYPELIADALTRPGNLYLQPKLDGMRCIARADGLWTRTGQPIKYMSHIVTALSPFFEKDPDAVLDGELYNHILCDDFNRVMSLCKKAPPDEERRAEVENIVQYHIYDYYSELPFGARNLILEDWLNQNSRDTRFLDPYPIVTVPTTCIQTLEDLDGEHAMYMQLGYEGTIIRLHEPYQLGKRSKFLLKRKEFLDGEYPVVDILPGKGIWSNAAKSVVFRLPDGRTNDAGIKGSLAAGRKLLQEKDRYIGGDAYVRFLNWTPDGKARGAVVHHFYEGKRTT